MLTVEELHLITGKPENTIRYWITHDKRFVENYWHKGKRKLRNSKGYSYYRDVWLCQESDAENIIKYIENKENHHRVEANKWSNIAIHCFERKMRCKGCCFEQYCSKFTHPPLKKKVLEFIRLYGEPRYGRNIEEN